MNYTFYHWSFKYSFVFVKASYSTQYIRLTFFFFCLLSCSVNVNCQPEHIFSFIKYIRFFAEKAYIHTFNHLVLVFCEFTSVSIVQSFDLFNQLILFPYSGPTTRYLQKHVNFVSLSIVVFSDLFVWTGGSLVVRSRGCRTFNYYNIVFLLCKCAHPETVAFGSKPLTDTSSPGNQLTSCFRLLFLCANQALHYYYIICMC